MTSENRKASPAAGGLKGFGGKIWRGPFSAGPLVQPLTFPAIFGKCLEVIWKGGVLSIGTFATIMIIGGVVMGVSDILNEREKSQREYARSQIANNELTLGRQVNIEVISGRVCERFDGYGPVFRITNNSSAPIYSISWKVETHRVGFSNRLGGREYGTNRIINQNSSYEYCGERPHGGMGNDIVLEVYEIRAR